MHILERKNIIDLLENYEKYLKLKNLKTNELLDISVISEFIIKIVITNTELVIVLKNMFDE